MNCSTTLMPHQIQAVEKLLPIRVGALFMEMGTGKTRAAIEFIARRQGNFDRAVWFCPVSLRETIRAELVKHTDIADDRLCVFDDRTTAKNAPKDRLVYIVGIETMSSSNRAVLAARRLITDQSFVIVDESSYIKGHWAIRTRRITTLSENCRYRLILTGTPISQGVVDLFAQMRFLSPRILGYRSFYSFARNHLEYSTRIPGKIVRVLNTEHLAKKIQPYVYQVTKEECLDLPEKLHDSYWAETTPQQRGYYQAAKEFFTDKIRDETNFVRISHYIFGMFTALQEIACGFWNRRAGDKMDLIEIPNNRLDMLMETLREIDGKVIIWSKFVYNIRQIERALAAEYGIDHVSVLRGAMNKPKRESSLVSFRGSGRFLVASPGVGGHGFTFNEAHNVVFFSNGFKYSERIQAEDRCHRIGQDSLVTYIDINVSCGIDQRIQKALAKKSGVVEEFRREVESIKDKKADLQKAIEAL